MMEWVREGISLAHKYPAWAVGSILAVLFFFAVAVLAIRVSLLVGDLRQETEDRIQLACNMSFANGQALLDTAAQEEEIPPETIELYRRNLQRYANIEIKKFSDEFECEIPEAEESSDAKDA